MQTAPPLAAGTRTSLSLMMFLQYAIWGAWLPLLWPFLIGHRGLSAGEVGDIFAMGAVGAILAPMVAGQIADRFFATERFLGLSHLVGAVLVWQLARLEDYTSLLLFSLGYSIIYSPTLSLTNSLAFHHLPDRDRDFGKVRVWGTVGWIAVGICIGQWLLTNYTPSEEEAFASVVEAEVLDAEQRAINLEHWVVTTTGEKVHEGKLLEELPGGGYALELENDEGELERTEFAADEVAHADPRYRAVLAKRGEADDGERESVDEAAAAALLSALQAAEGAEGEGARAALQSAQPFSEAALAVPVAASQQAGMADAFKLSAVLGILMGLFCFFLPHTPPNTEQQSNATLAALREIRMQPLLTLFLLAVPISCIHQFYFVHTAGFLGAYQSASGGVSDAINRIFGVGGGGLMTLGQVSELAVLALIPVAAKRVSRKGLLAAGIVAYGLRMALFAYVESLPGSPLLWLILGVALHGFCFGCFIFVAFMIVDEETSQDVRASAQSLFNLVIIGIGIIVGSKIATGVAEWATVNEVLDYRRLFDVPMKASAVCLAILLIAYPNRSSRAS